MNDETLKELWQEQPLQRGPSISDQQQIQIMKTKMRDFERTIRRRDRWEIGAAILVVICNIVLIVILPFPLARVGCAITVIGMGFICWKLKQAQRGFSDNAPATTLIESTRHDLQKIEGQIHLLKSVLWWYLALPILGANLFDFGLPVPLRGKFYFLIATILFSAFIYWLNQRAVSRKLLPMKRDLESLLDSASEPSH